MLTLKAALPCHALPLPREKFYDTLWSDWAAAAWLWGHKSLNLSVVYM